MQNDELINLEQELTSLQRNNQYYESKVSQLNRHIEEKDSRIKDLIETSSSRKEQENESKDKKGLSNGRQGDQSNERRNSHS